mgnify:CR=1 FL=1
MPMRDDLTRLHIQIHWHHVEGIGDRGMLSKKKQKSDKERAHFDLIYATYTLI